MRVRGQYSTGKPWILTSWKPLNTNHPPKHPRLRLQDQALPPWCLDILMTLVPQQENACCHTKKAAKQQYEEHDKDHVASDALDPNLI